ncbi:MAG: 50S ribosomal protein L6 [Patescibacteria group bacterium]
MSRIGKQLIKIPAGVEAKIEANFVVVKGPKGELRQEIHPQVKVAINDGIFNIKVEDETEKSQRALWGLFGSLIKNMVLGVTEGFSEKLEINGIGFKAAVSGKKLILNVGFSHPVEYAIPDGIEIKMEGNIIAISGIDKQLVGETAAQIKRIKKPEPYKGKGIKYADEVLRRKAGKAAAK